MFHHLERDEKEQSLHEIRRVLRPGIRSALSQALVAPIDVGFSFER